MRTRQENCDLPETQQDTALLRKILFGEEIASIHNDEGGQKDPSTIAQYYEFLTGGKIGRKNEHPIPAQSGAASLGLTPQDAASCLFPKNDL